MKKINLVLLLFLFVGTLMAQNIDVSKLSPEQLAAYKKYKGGSNGPVTNTTPDNVTERSVNDDDDSNNDSNVDGDGTDQTNLKQNATNRNQRNRNQRNLNTKQNKYKYKYNYEYDEQKPVVKPKVIFGSYLFSKNNLTFEPKLNIPTPPKYILGTYDELIIDVSGMYEANYKLKVSLTRPSLHTPCAVPA